MILVIDDNPVILDILQLILEEEGFDVISLESGENVFTTVIKEMPDLIIMDVLLGDYDGRDICQELKSNSKTSEIAIILISGTHQLANTLHLKFPPNDFVEKPFDVNHLVQKVHSFLAP